MFARWLALGVWALVAGSAVFWGLKLLVRPLAVPPQASVAAQGQAPAADLSRLFGVEAAPVMAEAPPPPPESSRFQLIGVVAARALAAHSQGVALIAVDGKMPRAYRVGATVDSGLVLQSVHARTVALGPRGGAATVSLELPPLPPPATGVPGAAGGAAPGAVQGAFPGAVPGGFPGAAPMPAMAGQPVRPVAIPVPPPRPMRPGAAAPMVMPVEPASAYEGQAQVPSTEGRMQQR